MYKEKKILITLNALCPSNRSLPSKLKDRHRTILNSGEIEVLTKRRFFETVTKIFEHVVVDLRVMMNMSDLHLVHWTWSKWIDDCQDYTDLDFRVLTSYDKTYLVEVHSLLDDHVPNVKVANELNDTRTQ